LTVLRELTLHENRISDEGVRPLSRSRVMETLRVLDLTGNLITEQSQDRLHDASRAYHWQGPLELRVDSQLRARLQGIANLRRPL